MRHIKRLREDKSTRPSYIPGLDGLRAIAVLTVIASHAGLPHTAGGKTGVVLFFVISGYLITSILVRELDQTGRVRLGMFYANRGLRLLPAMALATTAYFFLSLALAPFSSTAVNSLSAIPSAALYYLNWWNIAVHTTGSSAAGYLGLYWSLAVEEQFYILWPLVLWLAYRLAGQKGVMWTAFLGAFISYAVKWLFVADAVRQTGTDLSADALLVGCGLAILIQSRRQLVGATVRYLGAPAFILLVLAFVLGQSESQATVHEAAIYSRIWWPLSIIASAILVSACATRSLSPSAMGPLEWMPVAYLGKISYGIYLWHQVPLQILNIIWHTDGVMSLVRLATVITITITLAWLSYELVEKPFLKRKLRTVSVKPLELDKTARLKSNRAP